MYTKTNRNSLGQFLRSRERMIWMSAAILPGKVTVTPDGVRHVGPNMVQKPGLTFKHTP